MYTIINYTRREQQIMQLDAKGYNNCEIALILQLKITTIKVYRRNIINKAIKDCPELSFSDMKKFYLTADKIKTNSPRKPLGMIKGGLFKPSLQQQHYQSSYSNLAMAHSA